MLRYLTVRTRRGGDVRVLVLGPDGATAAGKAPLLLVHPVNLRKECWLDVMCRLAADRMCVAPDLAGHGESSDPGGFSLAQWVADCHDVVSVLDLDRVHLVGGSLGGPIALCAAAQRPARVVSVAAMGSSLHDEPDEARPVSPATALERGGTVEELFAGLALAAVAPGAPPDLVATVRHLTNTHGVAVVRRILDAAWSADPTPWTAAVRCPVLVLSGECDTTDGPAAGARMAARVGGRHEVLSGVGHLPMLEDPAAVVELLVPHLEAAERAAAAQRAGAR